MAIQIGSIGYNHVHEKDFRHEAPKGPGAFQFILVKSPAVFVINGKRLQVKKNSYVMLHPKTSTFYWAAKDFYIDDWFYFGITEEDENELKKIGLEFDKPVYIGSALESLSSIIHQISYEHFSADLYHEKIKQNYTDTFFFLLARIVNSKNQTSSKVLASKNDKITYLRTRFYEEPDLFTSVDEMAAFVGLSRSGLQHLYKKTFGLTLMEDVISGRLEKAKSLLARTNMTIAEIAAKCGYKTEFHFMRQFKQKTSFTPSEFRKGDSWMQGINSKQ
ncbi:MAG: AraC family transcriptional regulator [Treponema sp.]|nr:AraC family transcriptional regulator [Treponema sp.]